MPYAKHRHFFRLVRRWNYPDGYVFICHRCENESLQSQRFIRYSSFWGTN